MHSTEAVIAAVHDGSWFAEKKNTVDVARRILPTLLRITGNQEDAEDFLQNALLQAFMVRAGFRGQSKVSTWIGKIAINESLEGLRQPIRRKQRPIQEFKAANGSVYGEFDFLPSLAAHPPSEIFKDEARKAVQATVLKAIKRLPSRYRAVVMLRDIEELSIKETQAVLGIGREAVKTRTYRGRQQLKESLSRVGPLLLRRFSGASL